MLTMEIIGNIFSRVPMGVNQRLDQRFVCRVFKKNLHQQLFIELQYSSVNIFSLSTASPRR